MTRWVFIAGLVTLALAACGSGSDGSDRTNGEIAFGGEGDIYVVRPDGSGLRNLTRTEVEEYAPVWSPDGTEIAFTASSDIFVMAADGSGRRQLTSGSAAADPALVSWSPYGERIAFESSGGDLLVVESKGGPPRTLLAASSVDGISWATEPAWSPDGTRIAFAGRGSEAGLYVVPASGGDAERLTRTESYDVSPSWSPDGESIAFCRWPSGIHVVDAEGGTPRLLADRHCGAAAWSPDGTQIAFTASSPTDSTALVFVMDADGSEPRQLTRDLDSGFLSWRAVD